MKRLAITALSAAALAAGSVAAHAEETLMLSARIPATGILPPAVNILPPSCADTESETIGPEAIALLGSAVDALVGHDLADAAADHPDFAAWAHDRLGLRYGEAFCRAVCAVLPGGSPFTLQAEIAGDLPWSRRTIGTTTELRQTGLLALFDGPHVAQSASGAAEIVCWTLRNWAPDAARTYTIWITY